MPRGFTSFEGGGTAYAPFIDSRDFDAAAIALYRMADWIADVEVPLQQAKQIAIQDMADRFDNQVDPLGKPWEKLTRAYAAEKQLAVGFVDPILTRSTALSEAAVDQTAWFIEGDAVMFSTANLPSYWKYHQQEGGRYPKFKTMKSQKWIKGTVRGSRFNENDPSGLGRWPVKSTLTYQEHGMPQRAFIGLSVEAQAEIEYVVDQWLNKGFLGGMKTFEAAGGGKTVSVESVEDTITRKIVRGAGGKPQWHIGGKWGPMV